MKFVVNFLFWCWSWTNFEQLRLLTYAASSCIRLHLVTLNIISLDYLLQHEFLYVVIPQKTSLLHGRNTWSVLVNSYHYQPNSLAYSRETTSGNAALTYASNFRTLQWWNMANLLLRSFSFTLNNNFRKQSFMYAWRQVSLTVFNHAK